MPGEGPAAGCCCFFNHIRYLILILTTICVSTMYSNLIFYNFASVLHTDLSVDERPVAGLDSLHEYTIWHDRRRREIANKENVGKYDGTPILPVSITSPPPTTTALRLITRKTKKPNTIFITNSPTTVEKTVTPKFVEREANDVVLSEVEKTLKKLEEAEKRKNSDFSKNDDYNNDGKITKLKQESAVTKMYRMILYSSPGFGIILGSMVSIPLARIFGIRKLFFIYLLLSSLFSFVLPFATSSNYFVLLIVRTIQGVLFSVVFPVMGDVLIHWGPLKEQLSFLSVMLMFIAIGPIFSWPFSMILHSNEVPLYILYAIHGGGLVILSLVWIIFYRDKPHHHPWVNGVELNKIVAGKVQELQSNRTLTNNYASLTRSLSAWSIWISVFGLFLATCFFATYLPAFLCSQDLFFVDYLGIYSVLPFVFMPITSFLMYLILKCGTASTKVVRIWNTVGFVTASVIILLLPIVAYMGTENGPLYIISLTMSPFGIAIVGGFANSLTIVGRVYAQKIVALCSIACGTAFILMPMIVSFVVENNKLSDWTRVFMALVFVLLISAVEFAVFGRGRSASWAESSWDPLVASTKMQSLALIDFNQDECGLYELRRVDPSK